MSTSEAISSRRDQSGRRALILWGAVLVLSGSGIGAGGALFFHKPPTPVDATLPDAGPAPGVPNFSPAPIVSHMTRELNLTPEQSQQVTDAYAQSLAAIKKLRSDMIVKLTAEHEKLRAAMKKTLTDVQFAQWDQHFEAMRSRMMPDAPPWRDFHHPGGPGGEMGPPDGPGRMPGMRHGPGPDGPDGPDDRPGDGADEHRHSPGPPGRDFRGEDDGPPVGPPGEPGRPGVPRPDAGGPDASPPEPPR